VKKALFYPAAVLVVAVIVTVVLLLFVIPQFEACTRDSAPTCRHSRRPVINISKFLQHNGIFMAIALAWAVIRLHLFPEALQRPCANSSTGCRSRFRSSGPILNKAAHRTLCAHAVGQMFSAGVPLRRQR